MATIRSQKSITSPTYQCSPVESGTTLRLLGTTPPGAQAVTGPPATGPGQAPSGSYYGLVNQSGVDATFAPVAGQTVGGQASLTIAAGEAVTLELCGTDWVRIAGS